MGMSRAEFKRKLIEHLILLIIGDFDGKISILHIQKEVFLLCNFSNEINELYDFVKHYKGPYLDLINNSVKEPFFLSNCWNFIPPKNNDILSGGFVVINENGKKEFQKFVNNIKVSENRRLLHILNAIEILNNLYGSLDLEELLLLIYYEYPDFTEKSSVYSNIAFKKEIISRRLLEKGWIDEQKYEELLKL